MTLQWIVSNFPDVDLIPSNVKDGVNIFDVEWTFWGVGWGVGTPSSIYITSLHTVYSNTPYDTNKFYTQVWTKFYFILYEWYSNTNEGRIWIGIFDTVTLSRYFWWWSGQQALTWSPQWVSVYMEWTVFHCNWTGWWWNYYHFDYDFDTETRWTKENWLNTTGTQITNTTWNTIWWQLFTTELEENSYVHIFKLVT